MASIASKRTTAYAEYVWSLLPSRVAEGQGLYNYKELAELVGLKPTPNFRKRVKQLVSSGHLSAVSVFTSRNSIENRFMANPSQTNGDYAF